MSHTASEPQAWASDPGTLPPEVPPCTYFFCNARGQMQGFKTYSYTSPIPSYDLIKP